MKKYLFVFLYLSAIVIANWVISTFGPDWSIVTAFSFIGLNITVRDYLHEVWRGKQLKRNMALLITAGAIASILFNAGWIALASLLAFVPNETLDTYIYHRLDKIPHLARVNLSNVVSSIIDSVLFLSFAALFVWGWPPPIEVIIWQSLVKILGGGVWSLLFKLVLRSPNKALQPTAQAAIDNH